MTGINFYEKDVPQVVITYVSKLDDLAFVDKLLKDLKKESSLKFWVIPFEPFLSVLKDKMNKPNPKILIFLLSSISGKTLWNVKMFFRHLEKLMLEDKVYVILAKIEKCEIPEELRYFQYVNLTQNYEKGLSTLIQKIQLKEVEFTEGKIFPKEFRSKPQQSVIINPPFVSFSKIGFEVDSSKMKVDEIYHIHDGDDVYEIKLNFKGNLEMKELLIG